MEDLIGYEGLIEKAIGGSDLRGVIRQTLAKVAEKGLPGSHHIYLTFLTNYPGVALSEQLLQRYPAQMKIILQHQFWDLELNDKAFSVTLNFSGVQERLFVPYDAIVLFADPSVHVAIGFSEITGRITTLLVGKRRAIISQCISSG